MKIEPEEWGTGIRWIGEEGEPAPSITLNDMGESYKLIFCFQSWCPGCHSHGFPSLLHIINSLPNTPNISFLAIQTVFEGFEDNTFEKLVEAQKKYELNIPFGHDAGEDESGSEVMKTYNTRGTPWFLLLSPDNKLIYSDFNINPEGAVTYLKEALSI